MSPQAKKPEGLALLKFTVTVREGVQPQCPNCGDMIGDPYWDEDARSLETNVVIPDGAVRGSHDNLMTILDKACEEIRGLVG